MIPSGQGKGRLANSGRTRPSGTFEGWETGSTPNGAGGSEFWFCTGAQGVEWLVRRLRDETHVEVLHDAAALLADLGRASIGPIIEELDHDPAPDQTRALFAPWVGSATCTSGRPWRGHRGN